MIFYINISGGSNVPLCSSPPMAFRRDLLRHQHRWQQCAPLLIIVDGVPAWFSSSTTLRAAVNPLARLHRRQHSGVDLFIDGTEGRSEPPRSSPPPMVFRHGLLHQQHWGQQRTPLLIFSADGVPAWSRSSTALGKQCAPTTICSADGILA